MTLQEVIICICSDGLLNNGSVGDDVQAICIEAVWLAADLG